MVKYFICSRFAGPPPPDARMRIIPSGPLYPPSEVLKLIKQISEDDVIAWTEKCILDLQNLNLDARDLMELVTIAVTRGRFRKSEWCIQAPNGPWAACDAYSLVRKEFIEKAYREMDVEYYLKFAISLTGAVLLIISCHPPEDRVHTQ